MAYQLNGKPLGALPKTSNIVRARSEGLESGQRPMSGTFDQQRPNQDMADTPTQQQREKVRKKRWNKQQKRERKEMRQGEGPPNVQLVDNDIISIINENEKTLFNDPAILSINIPPSLKPTINKLAAKSVGKQNLKQTNPVLKQRAFSGEENRLIQPLPAINITLTPIQRFHMEMNAVKVLDKRSLKHPKAGFICSLCQYYCDTIAVVEKHVTDQRHKDAKRESLRRSTIINMPPATKSQLKAITEYINYTFIKHGMSNTECLRRRKLADTIHALVSRSLPSCSVRLYGSSASGMGLLSSDVNLDLVIPSDQTPSKIMIAVTELIESSGGYEQIECRLNADLPAVTFVDSATKLQCIMCHNSHSSYDTTMLLAQYDLLDIRVKPLATMFRSWAEMCRIDKPELGGWPSYAFALMLVYYLQQMENPVLPVLHDLADEPNPERKPSIYLDAGEVRGKWRCKNTMSLGELWLGLLRFYALDFAMSELVVCIQQKAPLKRSVKKWTGRKMAIEDPFLSKRNVSRSIVCMVTFDFIMTCFQNAYKYYAIPCSQHGPIFAEIVEAVDPSLYPGLNMAELLPYNEAALMQLVHTDPCFGDHVLVGSHLDHSNLVVTVTIARTMFVRFDTRRLTYLPTMQRFWGNETLPVVCCVCQQEGHLRDQCPEEELPPIEPLPPMTESFKNYLTEICMETFGSLSPTSLEMEERQEIVSSMEQYLTQFYKTAQLELFGSSCNGFGLHRSDLDICLTLKDNPTGESLNLAAIVEEMSTRLRKCKLVNGLVAITTAKVPILKFVHTESKLEGDISVYNTLAQRNTKLLRAYSDIDPRVRMLGFMMKKFAKLCDICDASRGSLSSYAYVLLVIYFLQQCDVPVLPVLQKLCVEGKLPTPVMVEDYNTYFLEDISQLGSVWPGLGKNTARVGELWLQLLDFYAAGFDYKSTVICIRQLEVLPRFEKLWNTKSMAIEDPFDVTHNLGAGLSRKMHVFILKALIKGRAVFGTPMNLQGFPLEGYFFDKKRLCDGAPPNDRGCRVCKKIGHQAKDCQQKRPANWRQEGPERNPRNTERGQRMHNDRQRGAVGFSRPPNGFVGYQSTAPTYRGPFRNSPPNGLPNGHQYPALMGYNLYQRGPHLGHLQQHRFIGPASPMSVQERQEFARQTAALANKFHQTPTHNQW